MKSPLLIILSCCFSQLFAQNTDPTYATQQTVKGVVIISFVPYGEHYCSNTPVIIPNNDSSEKIGKQSVIFLPVTRVNHAILSYDTAIIKTDILPTTDYLNPIPGPIRFDSNAVMFSSLLNKRITCYNSSNSIYKKKEGDDSTLFIAFNISADVIQYTNNRFFVEQLGYVTGEADYPKDPCFPTELELWWNYYVLTMLNDISPLDERQMKLLQFEKIQQEKGICINPQ
jgi:hypothetical protein